MKRSIRLPFSLILLVAVLTLLSSRAALRRRLYPAPAPAPSPLNSTLLRLAAADPSEPDLRRDVNELLDGNLASSSSLSGRHRSISLYRRTNDHHPRHPIRLRSPRDRPVVLPEFRRALRDWFRRRQYQASVMSDLLSQIKPRTSPATADRRYSTCAVVGNSGILLQRDQGGLIDSHDLVVRLNNARVEGYQRSVGAKTGISFVNSNILHLCARRESCFCHPYGEAVPIVMYICQPVHFLDYAACNSSHKSPLIVTDPRFDLLAARIVKYYSLKLFVDGTGKAPEEWGKAHNEKMFHYSSGMQAVLLAVGICDQVSVFGFGKSDGAKHHYHTNQKAELDLHDYEAEYAFYHDLVDRPQVIPFLGDSGFKVPPVVFYH